MTLVSTRGPIYFPALDHACSNGAAPTVNNAALDASGEKLALLVTAWQAGTLHRPIFRTGTVTTGDTMKVSFQDVDLATGDPDGVADQFRTVAIGNGDDNVPITPGILSSDGTDNGTKRTVTQGQQFFVVIEFNAYVAGALNIVMRSAQTPSASGTAYATHFTAAWAKLPGNLPLMAIEYSDGSFQPFPYVDPCVSGIAGEAYNSGTTSGSGGDERGLIFQVPHSCKVRGFWANVDIDNDAEVVLYDSDGASVLGTMSLDPNVRTLTVAHVYHGTFATEITLQKDTSYRLALKPTTGSNVGLMVGSVPSAAAMDAYPGGQACHYTARTDGGLWAQTTTKRPFMGVILSALDDGATAGGGGMRGVGHGGLVA